MSFKGLTWVTLDKLFENKPNKKTHETQGINNPFILFT